MARGDRSSIRRRRVSQPSGPFRGDTAEETDPPSGPAEAAVAPLPELGMPAEIGGRYERREELGKGGMGVVWRYWDRRLDRAVALKTVRASLPGTRELTRFEDEVRITTGLQHPGIIPVYDLGRLDDGRLWFAM
jgi:eukaryotic-like serine/threonine-protein kinase